LVLYDDRSKGYRDRQRDDYSRMSERKEKSDGDGTFPRLHELARDVIDCGNVVGVHGMPQSEGVGNKSGSEQQRARGERSECERPSDDGRRNEQHVDGDDFGADVVRTVVNNARERTKAKRVTSRRVFHGCSTVTRKSRCSGSAVTASYRRRLLPWVLNGP